MQNSRVSPLLIHPSLRPPGCPWAQSSAPARRNRSPTATATSRPNPTQPQIYPPPNHDRKNVLVPTDHSPIVDPLQPAIPHRIPLRRIGRHPRPRILQRFPLLSHLLAADGCTLLRAARGAHLARGWQAVAGHEPVFPGELRVLGRRVDEWAGGVHLDVDAVLRAGEGVIWFSRGARDGRRQEEERNGRRERKNGGRRHGVGMGWDVCVNYPGRDRG